MSTSNSKKENKNTKALFSIICLCIVALGLIVYFSTSTATKNNTVNQATTIKESTTEVQRAITVKETTKATTQYTKQTTKKKPQTTKQTTMKMGENNTPYKSYYKYPLSEIVAKGYSEELTFDETMNDYRSHSAVDFSGKEGDKVVAINDGIVTKVYKDSMYGTCVEIDHGGKLVATYCGLESANVKKGQSVDIGNQIGVLGKVPCESTLETHLHLSTKVEGKTVNPLDVMSKTE